MSTDRLARLTAAMHEHNLAALVLMPDANLHYLTGLKFHRGERLTLAIFPADGSTPCFAIPALDQTQAEARARLPMHYFPWLDADGPDAALRAALDAAIDPALRGKPLGIEHRVMRVMELRALEQALPGVQTSDATRILANMRMVKDADELTAMAEAARIVEVALHETITKIRPGMTERQLSSICADAIAAAGGEGESFPNIIASGPNSANPHHINSDRAFQPGDLIIIDCGAIYQGYLSDITRTVALGDPGIEARRIYELVLAANIAGRAAVCPNITGERIDQAAREVITDGGYGERFIHRTGHGLGLEVHELPNIMSGSVDPLPAGVTFTIEPGIYVPGLGGVRIEDDVVVATDGGHSLTSFERELIVLPM